MLCQGHDGSSLGGERRRRGCARNAHSVICARDFSSLVLDVENNGLVDTDSTVSANAGLLAGASNC